MNQGFDDAVRLIREGQNFLLTCHVLPDADAVGSMLGLAEVGALDQHRQAEVGFAVVSNDARHANSMLDKVSGFVSGLTEAVVLDRQIELLHVGEGERSYGAGPLGGGAVGDDPYRADEDDDDWEADER